MRAVETAKAEGGLESAGEAKPALAEDLAGPAVKTRRTIQSVERALDALEVLGRAGTELSLSEIALQAGLNVATCHHLLSTLAKRGYVGQNPRGRTYFLGTKILELSSSRVRQFNLVDTVMPELRRLNQETRESVHLAVMQGHDLVTLAKLDSSHPIRVGTDAIGKSNAAHATATGKAILAWLPEPEIARVIAEKGLTRFTENTITEKAELIENLRLVRRNGFALDREEFQPGVTCVGAAIRDHMGAVIGSISCSMPEIRATEAQLAAAKSAVRRCATTLSEKLGTPKDAALFQQVEAAE